MECTGENGQYLIMWPCHKLTKKDQKLVVSWIYSIDLWRSSVWNVAKCKFFTSNYNFNHRFDLKAAKLWEREFCSWQKVSFLCQMIIIVLCFLFRLLIFFKILFYDFCSKCLYFNLSYFLPSGTTQLVATLADFHTKHFSGFLQACCCANYPQTPRLVNTVSSW